MAVETALVALRVYLHNSLYSEPLHGEATARV